MGEGFGGSLVALGHLEVAPAIGDGAADVGVATLDVALAYGLHFIPLAAERYDLVIPVSALQDRRVVRLLETMTSGAVRRELGALGYDTGDCGVQVAEVKVL